MRISLSILGFEVCALSLGSGDDEPILIMEPGTIASQVEHAMPHRIGFHVDTNPSLDE